MKCPRANLLHIPAACLLFATRRSVCAHFVSSGLAQTEKASSVFITFIFFIETRLLIASLIKKSRSFSVYNFQRSLLKVYNIASLRHSYHLWTSTFILSVDFRHSYLLWTSDIRILCGFQTLISSADLDIHIICGLRYSYHLWT